MVESEIGLLTSRLALREGRQHAGALSDDPELTEDFGAFGWLRGVRERAVMLELKLRTGNIVAVGYGWLERAEFDPSVGITLLLPGRRIQIRGRNLNAEARPGVRLFEGITRHRVPWARETQPTWASEGPAYIDHIHIAD